VSRATVVHVITELELGGAQEITLFSCRHLDRRRYDVHLITGRGGMLDDEAASIPELDLAFEDDLVREVSPVRDFRCLRSLTRRLRAIRERSRQPMIVHTHSSKAGILGRWAAFVAGAAVRVHGIHGFGFHPGQRWPVRTVLQVVEQLTAKITHGFCAVSEANLELARNLGLLRGEKPAILLPSGIEPSQYEPRAGEREAVRAEIGVSPSTPLVGMIACLKPQKAPVAFVDVAARVAGRHPAAHFFIAGDGALRASVEERIERTGLRSTFHLLGWRRDVRRLLGAADVLVLTSLWEGLPRVTMQAMAAGKPMVATRVDGTPEAIRDGYNGFLVEPNDIAGFAEQVSRLVGDPELARTMGENARRRVEEFRADSMLRRLEAFYDELLARR
jgi:glycosyltransferase involved in cell wall biosynthesis